MAEQPQTIVQPAAPVDQPMGSRNQTNLDAMFAASPLYTDYNDDDVVKALYVDEALDGLVTSGLGFNSFNRDYTENDAPNLAEVETGGEGLPASPYVPNPTSPGPGNMTANSIAPYTGELPEAGGEFGSGIGATLSPSVSSAEIEKQTLGSYISGRSYVGSDGT